MEKENEEKIQKLESQIQYYLREINDLKSKKDPMVDVLFNELCEELSIVLHDDYLSPDKLSKNPEKQLKNVKSNLKMFLLDRGYLIVCPTPNLDDVNHDTMEVKFVTETNDKTLDNKVKNVMRFGILDNHGKAIVKAFVDVYKYKEPVKEENVPEEAKNSKKHLCFKKIFGVFNLKNIIFVGLCLISALLLVTSFQDELAFASRLINLFILSMLSFFVFVNGLEMFANKSRNKTVVESIVLGIVLLLSIVVGIVCPDYYLLGGAIGLLVLTYIPYLANLFTKKGFVKLSKISFSVCENMKPCYCFLVSSFALNLFASFINGINLKSVGGAFMLTSFLLLVVALLAVSYAFFGKNKVLINCLLAITIFSYALSFAAFGYNLSVTIINIAIIVIIISYIIFNKFKKEEK